jgi:hypothetical protein
MGPEKVQKLLEKKKSMAVGTSAMNSVASVDSKTL